MYQSMTRRGFFSVGAAASVTAIAAPSAMARLPQQPPSQPAQPPSGANAPSAETYERPPALNPELAREFVGVAHRDLERVRAMLDEHPTLLNASWDWTGGDWETAMGAAGHTAGVEIAELLLQRGARIELHAAAMLGWLDVIKAAVAAQPGAQNILGPHAIPMWSHALFGEERSAAVLAFLESVDAVRDAPLNEDERMKYVGRYRVEGNDEGDEFIVHKANRRLMLQPPQRRAWYMLHQGEHRFRPADRLEAEVTFEMAGDRIRAMHMRDGDGQTMAVRVD
jgi:hypothetical protein